MFTRITHPLWAAFMAILSISGNAGAVEILTIDKAVSLAIANDPVRKQFRSLAAARREQSVAAAQLPDPKLSFGLMNFPTDTFSRTQEPMTQITIGVSQMLPRGNSLAIRSRRKGIQARIQQLRHDERELRIRQTVRDIWLKLYYWIRAEHIIQRNRHYFTQLVKVTQYQYGAGKRSQQDVIRAQLELKMLDDRITRIRTRQDKLRARLAKWIGDTPARWALTDDLPHLGDIPSIGELTLALRRHPVMRIADAQVANSREGVNLARQAYKPGFMIGVRYGMRAGRNPNGSERPDFVSVGVTLDLPIFRDKRQDRTLQASQYSFSAMQNMRDERYRMLRRMLNARYAEWRRLRERIALYRSTLLPKARQNAEAALSAYQSDANDFGTLMKARITELNVSLQYLRLLVDRTRNEAVLRYLAGEMK